MKASELIQKIQKACKGQDLDVAFFSYEWKDDLSDMGYQERELESISKNHDTLRIRVTR